MHHTFVLIPRFIFVGCDGRGKIVCSTCNGNQEPGFYNENQMFQCSACYGRGLIAHKDGSDSMWAFSYEQIDVLYINTVSFILDKTSSMCLPYLYTPLIENECLIISRCQNCKGKGKLPCATCRSNGLIECQTCQGRGSLLTRKVAIVRWYVSP